MDMHYIYAVQMRSIAIVKAPFTEAQPGHPPCWRAAGRKLCIMLCNVHAAACVDFHSSDSLNADINCQPVLIAALLN